jgi:hypothetical protein
MLLRPRYSLRAKIKRTNVRDTVRLSLIQGWMATANHASGCLWQQDIAASDSD